MDAYIPPPSLGASRPLSRGDYGQENADDAPLVPPSNFFSSTLPTSASIPPSTTSNYIPPSNSLTLFNQPGSLHPGPVVHFHTSLQNTVFPSVSQSLPPSPLPSPSPAFTREVPPHLGLPDGAVPVRRRHGSTEYPPHTVPGVAALPLSDVIPPSTTLQPTTHPHLPLHMTQPHTTPMATFMPRQPPLPLPSLTVPPAPPPLQNIPPHQAFYSLPPPPTITVPPAPPPLPNILLQNAYYPPPPQTAFYPPPYYPHTHAPAPSNTGFAYPPHPFSFPAPPAGVPPVFPPVHHVAPASFPVSCSYSSPLGNSSSSTCNLPTLTHILLLSS